MWRSKRMDVTHYHTFNESLFVIKFTRQSELITTGASSERVVNVSDEFSSDGKKAVAIGELSVISGWNKMRVLLFVMPGIRL